MQPSSLDRVDGQPSSSLSPRILRSPEPSSLLDYARQTQVAAQAHRTAERIRQLTPEAESVENKVMLQDQGYGSSESILDGRSIFTGMPLRSNLFNEDHVATGPGVVDRRTSNLPRSPFKTDPPRDSASQRGFDSGEPGKSSGAGSVSLPEVTAQPIPATYLRRNITQRRSKGREKDDGTTIPRASLVSRRSISRAQDQLYVSESSARVEDCERQGWRSTSSMTQPRNFSGRGAYPGDSPSLPINVMDCERKDWRATSAMFRQPPADRDADPFSRFATYPVDSPTMPIHRPHSPDALISQFGQLSGEDLVDNASQMRGDFHDLSRHLDPSAPFLRQYIPSMEQNADLHCRLMEKWNERQKALEGLVAALQHDDAARFGALQCLVENLNGEMHQVVREAMNKGRYHQVDDNASDCSASSEPKYRSVDSLPIEHSALKAKRSYKEPQNGTFQIILSYQGVRSPRVVNDQMPVRVLFRMATSYLESDFKFRIQHEEDIQLEYAGQLLQDEGVLGNVPILVGAIIEIRYGPAHQHVAVPPSNRSNRDEYSSPLAHQGVMSKLDPGLGAEFKELQKGSPNALDSKSYDKIRQNFKCPRFSGQTREWKQWNKGLMRYLSIWDIDYVLDPSFFDEIPLSADKKRDNKLVYYILEDAVQNSVQASAYVHQAAINNGFEAYYTLHDGYVFSGTTTSALLLNELSNFRFLPNETPTQLCMRLQLLFEELSTLPEDAAMTFGDTQKIGYLINALRHESEWDKVRSDITSAQIKGNITFKDACNELRGRCEADRAFDMMDRSTKGKRVKGLVSSVKASSEDVEAVSAPVSGLISTMSKRHNADSPKKDKKTYVKQECLAADCDEQTTFPLCPFHYHAVVSGKTSQLKLRNGYGDAAYDNATQLIVYPPRTPTNRLPSNKKRQD